MLGFGCLGGHGRTCGVMGYWKSAIFHYFPIFQDKSCSDAILDYSQV